MTRPEEDAEEGVPAGAGLIGDRHPDKLSREGGCGQWVQTALEVLEKKGTQAAQQFIADCALKPALEGITRVPRSKRHRIVVPVAVLPEIVAQGKRLLVMNGKIATKLRRKHRVIDEDFHRLQELMKGMGKEDFVDVSGKDLGKGRGIAERRLAGWVRSDSRDHAGYAVVWEAKEDRSELVSFFRLRSQNAFRRWVGKQREAAATLAMD